VALAVAAAILIVGPLALTLMRSEDYTSTTTLRITDSPLESRLPESIRLSYLTAMLKVRDLQRGVLRDADWPEDAEDLPDYVSVQPSSEQGHAAYVLSARAPSADQANALATVSARELLRVAQNGVRLFFAVELRETEDRLESGDLEPAQRRALRRERDQLAAVVAGETTLYEPTATPATLPRERFADRLVGALPGTRSPRPNPLWACLAGAALAVALLIWVLALSPTRGSGSSAGRA
jgi:hypothetical protein